VNDIEKKTLGNC